MIHILHKMAPLRRPRAELQLVEVSVHLLYAKAAEELWQIIDQPIVLWRKEISGPIKCLHQHLAETIESRAGALSDEIGLHHTDHPSWPGHPLQFLQEFVPFPGAEETSSHAHIHEIERVRRKFEQK